MDSAASFLLQVVTSDQGTLKYLTSYEIIQTDKFFKIGYVWPQRELPLKSIEGLYKKLSQKLLDQGVFGYVTVLLTVCSVNNKNFKVCIDRVLPYYDEFMNIFEMLNLMVQPTQNPQATAVIIPRLQNLNFPRNLTYLKFFDMCRERNIQFDVREKSGTMFLLSDEISARCLGFVNVEQDKDSAIKYANQTLNNIASLFDSEIPEDTQVKNDVVSYSMAVECLFGLLKK